MSRNPELLRNVWLEITPLRLVLVPCSVGLTLLLVYLTNDQDVWTIVKGYGLFLFVAVVMLYGMRQATQGLWQEVDQRTWDQQKLSGMSPWSLAWGKLLGSTVLVWYGGLWCLMGVGVAGWQRGEPATGLAVQMMVLVLLGGLLQSLALVVALSHLRREGGVVPGRFGNLSVVLGVLLVAQMSPFLVITMLVNGEYPPPEVTWYLWDVGMLPFAIVSLAVFSAWSLLALYRNMRLELSFVNGPWAWPAFLLSLAVYANGFVTFQAGGGSWPREAWSWLVGAGLLLALFYYPVLLEERLDRVRGRLLVAAFLGREWRRVGQLIPNWALTLLLLALVALALAALALAAVPDEAMPQRVFHKLPLGAWWVPLSAFLFLARDGAMVALLQLRRGQYRPEAAALFYLAMLYGVIPALLRSLDLPLLVALFWPVPGLAPGWLVLAPLLQAALLWRWLWREMGRAPVVGEGAGEA